MNQEYKLKFCAKGSRKTGQAFIDETNYLIQLTNCLEIDFNFPHDANFTKEINYLIKLRKEKKINYTVHAQYLSGSLNDFNKKIRVESLNQVYYAIDQAKKLGASIVTLHPALEPYGLKLDKRKDLEIAAYKKIAAYAAKHKIKIGLENEAQTCFWFPDRACKFPLIEETINAVNKKNFGLTLDIGHANVSDENSLSAIGRFNQKIFHVHLHDNFGAPENNLAKFNRPDPHLPPGKGIIKWREALNELRKINYHGYLEPECEADKMKEAIEYLTLI